MQEEYVDRKISDRQTVFGKGETTHINGIGETLLKVVGADGINERIGGNITTNKDANDKVEVARVCGGLQQSAAPARYSND
eukprot:6191405-Pleurochrysis_carterae.AAC.2